MTTTSTPSVRTAAEPFVRRVRIRNYKSIGYCDIELGRFTILVGHNGAGKSNFLDALRFVSDALRTSIDQAAGSRGGIGQVLRRSLDKPRSFVIALELGLSGSRIAHYEIEIEARKNNGIAVKREWLEIHESDGTKIASYHVELGKLIAPLDEIMPVASVDRLYLTNASGLPRFREVYDRLIAMGFYNFNPDAMRELQSPDSGEMLKRDGSNAASVFHRLSLKKPKARKSLQEYLSLMVFAKTEIHKVSLGPKETLEFVQIAPGDPNLAFKVVKLPDGKVRLVDKDVDPASVSKFYASDGTLRAFGVLLALVQVSNDSRFATLVGIEEPESGLHPVAAGALMDAFRAEAETSTQVLITTHGRDLMDLVDLESDTVFVADASDNETVITSMDQACQEVIEKEIYLPGDLLSMDQFQTNRLDLERQEHSRSSFSAKEAGMAK